LTDLLESSKCTGYTTIILAIKPVGTHHIWKDHPIVHFDSAIEKNANFLSHHYLQGWQAVVAEAREGRNGNENKAPKVLNNEREERNILLITIIIITLHS